MLSWKTVLTRSILTEYWTYIYFVFFFLLPNLFWYFFHTDQLCSTLLSFTLLRTKYGSPEL